MVGERVSGERLAYFESTSCPHCGAAVEADGGEPFPEDIRGYLIARDGVWAVAVPPQAVMAAIAVVRRLYGLTLAEAMKIRTTPDTLIEGTRGEAERLVNALRAADLEGTARRSR